MSVQLGNVSTKLQGRIAASLTARELEILGLICVDGLISKQIGLRLGIAHRTVESHRGHIMEKLQAKGCAHLGYIVAKAGLV